MIVAGHGDVVGDGNWPDCESRGICRVLRGWVVVTGEQQIDRKYLDALEQGTFWATLAKWRTDNPSGVPDLSNAYLRNADLRGGDLSRTNLADADLTGAVLAGTNLSEADLRDATLVDANLAGR